MEGEANTVNMDYTTMSHDALIEKIEEITLLNNQLIREKQQSVLLDYSWTGNLGHWYWNIKTNSVTFNPIKVTSLGYECPDMSLPVPFQFFTEKLHPDDYKNTMEAMRKHLRAHAHVYECEYRIQAKDGSWHWFYDRGKITDFDSEGKPVFLAGIVFDITEKKRTEEKLEKKNKLLEEKSSTDGLTKLKNHRAVIELLRSALNSRRKSSSPLSIAMFDLDFSKL
jgi:PAS domain S-box-containing protein